MAHKKGFGMETPLGFDKSQCEALDEQVDIVTKIQSGMADSGLP